MPTLKHRNFLSASRKRNCIAFGMYRQDASADLEVIEDVGSGLLAITGTQDGSNAEFTLSAVPSGTNLVMVRNGNVLKINVDYLLSGNTVTFAIAPEAADILLAIAIGGE
jgi:hypothetical protein